MLSHVLGVGCESDGWWGLWGILKIRRLPTSGYIGFKYHGDTLMIYGMGWSA